MEERKKKDLEIYPANGQLGTKNSQKAEFRSLPSLTDLTSKKIPFYPVLFYISKHEFKMTATSLVSETRLRPEITANGRCPDALDRIRTMTVCGHRRHPHIWGVHYR